MNKVMAMNKTQIINYIRFSTRVIYKINELN